MSERRSLVEGLKQVAPHQQQVEEAFVYGEEQNPHGRPVPITKATTVHVATPQERPGILPQLSNRVPITTRTRPEVASALKRASLQRQLQGTPPFYVQDILEQALETWLKQNDYLTD
jgi:hypothetical protein